MDSYQRFFDELVSKDDLFEFGLKHSIFINKDSAHQEWEKLKTAITSNQEVHIRGYGRNGHGTTLFTDLYGDVFANNNVNQDPTNNASPKRLLQNLTGYRVNQNLHNFQIAHIFGKTKNPYSFTAPWNLAFIPKIIDPFTGHEAKGDYVQEYQKLFTDRAFNLFEDFIWEFNEIVTSEILQEKFQAYFKQLESNSEIKPEQLNRFKRDVASEFHPIARMELTATVDENIDTDQTSLDVALQNTPSIRQRAKTWLANHGYRDIDFKASKYIDRNNNYDWWFTFNVKRHLQNSNGVVNILCEKEPGSSDFFYFVIPNQLIIQHGRLRPNKTGIDIHIYQTADAFKLRPSNVGLNSYLSDCQDIVT
ncbi:MAG: hypothetical protein U9N57_13705 [Pseudomonadota bacterium]|nr:hypothetical protein [Pseudomonadota bacterium]